LRYISVHYTRQDLVAFHVEADGADPSAFAALEGAAEHPSGPQIKISKPEVRREEPLEAELLAFLDAVRTRQQPIVPLEDGRRALSVALDILARIREHGRRLNLEKLR